MVLAALAGLGCVAGGAALAQGVQLAMLDRIEPGMWELRARDGGRPERVCLDDGRRLIQLRHPNLTCRQFVVEDGADAVTVHYTCNGQGSGRTHLRLESSRLVQIESQGIAVTRLPFDFTAEARRVGSCTTS
ncbi:MAG: type II toxin-antitoxin system RelE/ParE family toxin [Novosphingobium sp.]|nr:type II toxin-antitoxin system RelE/ParE family toxin [Novosphingobium sp.]